MAAFVGLLGNLGSVSGLGSSLNACGSLEPFPCNSNSTISGLGLGGGFNTGGIAEVLLAIGLVTGGVIIFGGWLINSENPSRRKVGSVLVVVMILIGGLTTLGGLAIGFILASLGVYLAYTYRPDGRPTVIGLGPVGSFTLGQQGQASSAPAGAGPLNYCIKCGSQVREGAVFCGACGARLVS